MNTRNLLILLLLLCHQIVFPQKQITQFVENNLLRNANISLLVSDLKTAESKYEHRSTNATIPASTMKLVTTATALELLGPDFTFQTKLEIDGSISSDSILHGNLYIRGGGDPTLGSRMLGDKDFLSKWVRAIKHAGIKQIKGDIITDSSLFDDEGINPKWIWEDIGNYYASGVYGISYLDNTYLLTINSGSIGSTPQLVKVTPEMPDLEFDIRIKSSNTSADSAYIYGTPHSNKRTIYGAVPANKATFVIKGDIPYPALLLKEHFLKKLIENRILVNASTEKAISSERTTIYTHVSPTLQEIITQINVKSNNHYAEHVFRHLSLKRQTPATNNGSVKVIKDFWNSKGLPVDQLFMFDGSGLSPCNAVSARFFVDLLVYMQTKSVHKEIFMNSLAVAGQSGTLTSVLKGTSLQGKVHAKSGTIARVRCYAGYLTDNGHNFAFAILVNNANGSLKEVTGKIENFLLDIIK